MLVRIMEDCREPYLTRGTGTGTSETGSEAIYEGLFNSKTGRRYRGPRAGEQGMPKLTLPDGSVLWGYECWWTPEKEFQSWLKNPPANIEKLEVWRKTLQEKVLSHGQRFEPPTDLVQELEAVIASKGQ